MISGKSCIVENLSFLSCVRLRMPSAILKTESATAGDYNLTFQRSLLVTVIHLNEEIALDHTLTRKKMCNDQ